MSSLAHLKITTSSSGLCALNGCKEPADPNTTCTRCTPTPTIGGTAGNSQLPNISYCTHEHRDEDWEAHEEECTHRRWLRFVKRISELLDLVLAAHLEKTFLQPADIKIRDLTAIRIQYRHREGSTTFCSPSTPKHARLCALYQEMCCHAVLLGTHLLAYMNQDHHFRVKERHVMVRPRIAVQALNPAGKEIELEVRHTVFFLAPQFFHERAVSVGPNKFHLEDGIVLDPSAAQLGFFDTTISSWSEYQAAKAKPDYQDPDRYDEPFGSQLAAHNEDIKDDADDGAAIRTICNALFPELDRVNGAQGVIDMCTDEWEEFKNRVQETLGTEFERTRSRLAEDRPPGSEDLLQSLEGDGYKKMNEILGRVAEQH